MTLTIYGIPSCDTCRKAQKTLKEKGFELEFRDIRADPLDRADWEAFSQAFGEKLINTRSTTWRALAEEERKNEAVDLLCDHPTLMKRPVIDHDGALKLGWGKDVQATFA